MSSSRRENYANSSLMLAHFPFRRPWTLTQKLTTSLAAIVWQNQSHHHSWTNNISLSLYIYIYIYTVYTYFLYPHISDYIFLCTQTVSKHRNPLFTSMRLPHCIPIISHYSYVICWFTRGSTYKKLLKMAIEIVDLPIENGDFP